MSIFIKKYFNLSKLKENENDNKKNFVKYFPTK